HTVIYGSRQFNYLCFGRRVKQRPGGRFTNILCGYHGDLLRRIEECWKHALFSHSVEHGSRVLHKVRCTDERESRLERPQLLLSVVMPPDRPGSYNVLSSDGR